MIRLLGMLWALWVAVPAWGANVRVQLDTSELAVGQTGRLVVIVVDGRSKGAPQLAAPPGVDIRFYSSTQRFIASEGDGGFSRTLVYTYEYRVTGRAEGTYTLGPYEVGLLDGTRVETNTVALNVKPRPADPEQDAIRVEAAFDVTEAWEGQVVAYRYRMVSQRPVVSVEWRLPEFEGLRAPQQGNADERTYFVENPDGGQVTYVEGVVPLVATGTGKRDQVPALAQIRIPQGRPDILGFRQYRAETVPSKPASLQVRPLPPPGSGFSGLVGDFRVRATLDRTTAAVGESVGWALEIVGDGTLEGWSPASQVVDGASIYENDTTVTARPQDGRYVAHGVYERVVVPTREGSLQLPTLEVVTFSPSRGAYQTHRVDVPVVRVTAGRDAAAKIESFSRPGEAPVDDDPERVDFRDIYTWGPSRTWPVLPLLSALSVGVALPGLLVWLGVVGERVRLWRMRRREARRRPLTPDALLKRLPEDSGARWAALDQALRVALGNEGRDVTGLPDPLADRLRAVFTQLDRVRFAGEDAGPDLESDIRGLIDALRSNR